MKKLIYIACALLFCCACNKETKEDYEIIKVGDPVPQFSITDTKGATTFNSNDLQGRAVLIYFFSYTCPDCQRQTPAVIHLWNEYVKDVSRYTLLCIARGDSSQSEQGAQSYWDTFSSDAPLYYDANREVYSLFAKGIVPRFYAISPSGTVTWLAAPESTPLSTATLLEKLSAALK